MQFRYRSNDVGPDRAGETAFTLDRVWAREGGDDREVSHYLDRSYEYRSVRELRWHLADRFGLPPQGVEVLRT